MGSEEGGSDNNGATRSQDSLTRQASLYGLTFDEVQNQLGDLGKPLSSMNLDELLMTVRTVEYSNPAVGGGAPENGVSVDQHLGQPVSAPSNVKLSGDLSKKTVDEVWQIILQGQKRNVLDRKASLGDITLADFLVKAGVVAEPRTNLGLSRAAELPRQQAQWMNYNMIPSPVFMPCQPVPTMDGANYSENQMPLSCSSPLMGTLSNPQAPGRKRVAPNDLVEKIVERRQKRMIKNRESAARSRLRKQAYTNELENKVSRLEEENERLKRQKDFEKMLPSTPPPEPKYQLRRTRSSPV